MNVNVVAAMMLVVLAFFAGIMTGFVTEANDVIAQVEKTGQWEWRVHWPWQHSDDVFTVHAEMICTQGKFTDEKYALWKTGAGPMWSRTPASELNREEKP